MKKQLLLEAIEAIEHTMNVHSVLYKHGIDIANMESKNQNVLLKFIKYYCFDDDEFTFDMFNEWIFSTKKELVIFSKKDDVK